jgi:ABC-2 type transport system permease protein
MPELPLMMSSLLRADLTAAVRNRRSLLAPILMALILLLATRSARVGQHYGGHGALVALVTTFALMGTSILGYALIMGRDRETGVLRRLRVTPAPGWAIIASRMAAQGIAGLVLALVMVVVGGRIDGLSLSLAQYGMVLVYSVLGLIGQQGGLGGAWASIAPWSTGDTESLLACVGYIVVCAGLGIRWFRWLPAASSRGGLVGLVGLRLGRGREPAPPQQDEAGDRDTEQQDGADRRGHVHAVGEGCPGLV